MLSKNFLNSVGKVCIFYIYIFNPVEFSEDKFVKNFCLFVFFDSLHPSQQFSVMSVWVFLG